MTPKFHEKPDVQKARPRKKHKARANVPTPRELRKRGWAVMGFDVSMSSIAGAAIGYDETLKKFAGPNFIYLRWEKDDDYFSRLKEACNSQLLVEGLLQELGLILSMDEVFIAQEEPWPLGMIRGGLSNFLKQQAEISGAFLGGLVRWGYTNVSQMNSIRWRQMVAADLGITTHHSKWRSPELAARFNCKPADSGKFRAKQWALNPGYAFMGAFENEIPDWPDIISSKDGKKPRPEGSKAKGVQPDDRYDALAVCWTHYLELQELGAFDT
jgi:hypothetical protein